MERYTNDDYDNEFPDDSADAGLQAIYRRIWFYYSDLESHYLNRLRVRAGTFGNGTLAAGVKSGPNISIIGRVELQFVPTPKLNRLSPNCEMNST